MEQSLRVRMKSSTSPEFQSPARETDAGNCCVRCTATSLCTVLRIFCGRRLEKSNKLAVGVYSDTCDYIYIVCIGMCMRLNVEVKKSMCVWR